MSLKYEVTAWGKEGTFKVRLGFVEAYEEAVKIYKEGVVSGKWGDVEIHKWVITNSH